MPYLCGLKYTDWMKMNFRMRKAWKHRKYTIAFIMVKTAVKRQSFYTLKDVVCFFTSVILLLRRIYLMNSKRVFVFGKKWLIFDKNSDMKILTKREYFYVNSKGTS